MMIRSASPLALALAAALLTGCSGGDTPAEHSSADRADGHTSSSAGLPPGRIDAGEKFVSAKGPSGQACIDCHGKDGNTPLDPTYPKLGGQYADYLAHSIQMYRSGGRQNALMSAQAVKITDQQIADAAAYFSSRPSQLRDLETLD